MANFGSLIMGFAAVGAIGIASLALGQNKSRKINSFDDVNDVIHAASPGFDLSEILISENGNCALFKATNGEIFFVKSIGDEFAIRSITNAQITQNENQTKISFNDITFPDFSGVLTTRGN